MRVEYRFNTKQKRKTLAKTNNLTTTPGIRVGIKVCEDVRNFQKLMFTNVGKRI